MRPTTLERAFELAETGSCVTLYALTQALKAEGYRGVDSLLAHEAVRRRLSAAMTAARLAGAGALIEDASVGLEAVNLDPAPFAPQRAAG